MKGLAEAVFWNARQQNVRLPEDFDADDETFTESFFKTKAVKSLKKA